MDEEWSTSANEAIQISFCQSSADGPKELYSFNPEYTEQFFGQDQSIFGYKDLNINLRFAAHDVYPNLQIEYKEKWKSVGETRALNLTKLFKEYLPDYALNKPLASFDDRLKDASKAESFQPPGECVDRYTVKGRSYEIWAGELVEIGVAKLIERVQILIPFFIDGGILIPIDDPDWTAARWRVWFIFEKLPSASGSLSPYSLVGYCTAYRFLTYQPSTSAHFTSKSTASFTFPPEEPLSVSSLPNRTRISQFLILPPHQGSGHGTHLYNTAVGAILSDPACIELTVEDPNVHFDDLRDFCDYARLTRNGALKDININTDLDPKLTARRPRVRVPTSKLLDKPKLEKLRTKNKLAPRQFARLVEMHLLSQIAPFTRQASTARLTKKAASSDPNDKAFYYWRLLVKQRIYRQHKDVLMQLEGEERVVKLEETLRNQWEDYERLLKKMGETKDEAEPVGNDGEWDGEKSSGSTRGKRKIVDEDEEEEGRELAAKKPKAGEE